MAAGSRPFGHGGFDQRAAEVRALTPARSLAENVAFDGRAGTTLAAGIAAGWFASPGHRRNIEGDFDLTGIGAARASDGVTHLTQVFVLRAPR